MKWIKSFSFRLVAVTLLTFVLCISAVVAIISTQYRATMKEKDETTTLSAFEVSEKNIVNMLSHAGSTAQRILQHKAVDSYLFDTYANDLDRVIASRNMMNAISEQLSGTEELYGVLFFRSDASLVGALVPWRFSMESQSHPFYAQADLGNAAISREIRWLGAYPIRDFVLRDSNYNGNDEVLIVGASKTRYKYDLGGAGSIITLTCVSGTALSSLFDYLGDEQSSIYLLDAFGQQISGPDRQKVNVRPAFADALAERKEGGSFAFSSDAGKLQVIYHRVPGLNWTLVKTVPMKLYNEPILSLVRFTLVITALALVIVCALYIWWLTSFLKPLRIIRADLKRVRQGDISVSMHERFDMIEFEELRVGTNQMIESVAGMIQHTKEIERSRAELTLRNLQMQINPHMVFNAISAIRWMATFAGANTVADMLMELAELIRPIYSEWRVRWTVREELDYIRHYMRLIELRYGSEFKVEMDVDESLMEVQIPLFTLQPLMENSCEHGVHHRKELSICIQGRKDGDTGILMVKDNGCGIAPDVLENIRASIKTGEPLEGRQLRHTGMGIVNIDKRVRMFSGEGYGLSIDSTVDKGTVITVRFAL